MGTTADKLNKLLETKQAIRQAIITKGVDVGEDTKFADYPSRIAAIQTGSGEGTGGASDAFFNMRTQNGTNMYGLFCHYQGSELDLSILDTSKAIDMSMMFAYCSGLTSLDVSNFSTSNVTSMYQMFAFSNFHDINLSNFNTINVTDMAYMFASCSCLSSLDLSSFNTSSVNNMYAMFEYCSNLQSLDLSNFDICNVINMDCMFNYCNNLQSVNLSGWDTNNVINMPYMFQGTHLKTIDLSHFRTSQLQVVHGMFAYCNYLEEVNMSYFDMTNAFSYDDMFAYCPSLHILRLDNCSNDTISKIINSSNFPTGEATSAEGYPLNVSRQIYVQEANVVGLTAPDGWEFVYVESGGEPGTGGMPGTGGGDEPEVTPTPGGPEVPEEPEPTQTYQVNFSAYNGTGGNAKKLTVNNVDVSDQVVEVSRFEDTCSYRYETTEPITQVSFKDNTDLLRLFSLDSSNILDMSEMFDGCTSFVGIIGTIDTSSVLNMSYMFRNCTSLSSIPDSYFTSMANVMDMTGMYYNCSSMTGTVEAYKYWENSMTGSYSNCFYNCTALDNYSEIPASWGGPSDSE
jgi:surface protein